MSDHPDLEALSAEFDGEGGDADAGTTGTGTAAHVASCPACQARLAELASVRAAIGAPVPPPPPHVRERALAQALAAADPEPERSPFRWWLPGSAAAAVLVIVMLTVALVNGGLGGSQNDETGTALSAGPAQDNALESAPPASDQVTDGGDLGEVGDVATLRSRVTARTAAAMATSPGDATAAGGRSAAGSPAATVDPAVPQPRAVGTRVCEIEARTARPQLAVVVYAANLRYQGTAAVVLGFADRPGSVPVTLLVLAPGERCRVLAESTTP